MTGDYIGWIFFFSRLEMIFLSVILTSLTRKTPRADPARTAIQPFRTLLRCGSLIVLGVAVYWSARLARADYLSRSSHLASREHAVLLAPASSVLIERLAEKQEELGSLPIATLSRATRLAPANPLPLLRLGLQAELAGDYRLAERSFLAAAERSRLYQPRYVLAQFYFRRKNADEFFRWTHAALNASYGDVRPLLVLAWTIRPDPLYFADLARQHRQQIERQFLAFLLHQQETRAAGVVANHLAARAQAEDIDDLLKYCDQMLEQRYAAHAVAVWNILCRRNSLPFGALDAPGCLVTNGRFRWKSSGRGFDWRLEPVSGVETAFVNGTWRTNFSGKHPESFVLGWQYVPLDLGKKYRVQADFAGIGADPCSGLDWNIVYGPSPRLELVYQRPAGCVRIAGEVVIRNVRLETDQ